MKKGSRVVFLHGSDWMRSRVYVIRSITTDGKRVRLNQAVNHVMWHDINLFRIATKGEAARGNKNPKSNTLNPPLEKGYEIRTSEEGRGIPA